MKKYSFPVEIHTHTEHSDGSFTPAELIKEAKDFGYKGIILTDHNTSSGYSEMQKANLTDDPAFIILKGMEWTTYFGHMLVHNAEYDVDWREATPTSIDRYMSEVKEAGGLIGIAHPFDMGSPICTGCHWDFQVKDYNLVDYIEVWNSNNPQQLQASAAAYDMWLGLLNEGYRISASTGRDWHRKDAPEAIMGVTYLEVTEDHLTKENFIQALAAGNFYSTLGPTCEFTIADKKEKNYYMGDDIALSETELHTVKVTIQPPTIPWLAKFSISDCHFKIYNNDKIIASKRLTGSLNEIKKLTFSIKEPLETGYLRYELTGKIVNDVESKIIIGNPIYLI